MRNISYDGYLYYFEESDFPLEGIFDQTGKSFCIAFNQLASHRSDLK